MEKNDLKIVVSDSTIQVAGRTGSGKSCMVYFLKQFLTQNGFDVHFDGGVDFENISEFDKHVGKNIDEKISHIKKTRKITISEVQVNSPILSNV
jgi:nucleoside-triphosphatase THEP1